MLHESMYATVEAAESGRARQVQEEAAFLRHAAFETARGLYEAGTSGGQGSRRMRETGRGAERSGRGPVATALITAF